MKTSDVDLALKGLLAGEVVAIPTETVYGLAGWIQSEAGLKKIFSTKERPFFDPLIVHVDTVIKARALSSNWTEVHELLARKCWPGPLTLITKKAPHVSGLITSGLDSVGIRCPSHPVALALLAKVEGGLAAPSANKFGKTSPTRAEHVEKEFGDAVMVLEGGACEVGIESTVAGVSQAADGWKVEIYRPGFYTAEMLQEIFRAEGLRVDVSYAESPVAPGQLKHHYMPEIPLVIVPEGFDWSHDRTKVESKLGRQFQRPAFWQLPAEAAQASRMLYQDLRTFSENGHDLILIEQMPNPDENWLGIWNRLSKAKTLNLTNDLE